jgi:hypothetical protein
VSSLVAKTVEAQLVTCAGDKGALRVAGGDIAAG